MTREQIDDLGEPVLMVCEENLCASADLATHGAMRGRDGVIAIVDEQFERPEELREWHLPVAELETDRGRDGRQDVIAGERQPVIVIVEDDVSLGMAGRVNRFDTSAGKRDEPWLEPTVGLLPVRDGERFVNRHRVDGVGKLESTGPPDLTQGRRRDVAVDAGDLGQARGFGRPEVDTTSVSST